MSMLFLIIIIVKMFIKLEEYYIKTRFLITQLINFDSYQKWWIDRQTGACWIKEAIWIRKIAPTVNRDEGGYRLSRMWDNLFALPSGEQIQFLTNGGQNIEVSQNWLVV